LKFAALIEHIAMTSALTGATATMSRRRKMLFDFETRYTTARFGYSLDQWVAGDATWHDRCFALLKFAP